MSAATQRAARRIARALRAIAKERGRLHREADALRTHLRDEIARLRNRIDERKALTGPSTAEKADAYRDVTTLEATMRERTSAAVVRLRGLEVAFGRLDQREADLVAARERMDQACERLARERHLGRWRAASREASNPQRLSAVSAQVDAAIARAEASVARADAAVSRQVGELRRAADALVLERDGELPELPGIDASPGRTDAAALDADAWEALRVRAVREVGRLPPGDDALLEFVRRSGPSRRRAVKSFMSVRLAAAVGTLTAIGMILGALAWRSYRNASRPPPAPSAVSVAVPEPGPISRSAPPTARTEGTVAPPPPTRRNEEALIPVDPNPAPPSPPLVETTTEAPSELPVTKVQPAPRRARRRHPHHRTYPKDVVTERTERAEQAEWAERIDRLDRIRGLRVLVEQEPRSPWARLHLAAELEALGNPMAAVRHLDFLLSLDTDAARLALARAERDPALARWLSSGWWSAWYGDPSNDGTTGSAGRAQGSAVLE